MPVANVVTADSLVNRKRTRATRAKLRKLATGFVRAAIIAVACVFFLFPLYWALATSFKSPADIGSLPPKWIFKPTLDNYRTVLFEWDMPTFLRSSIIVASISTLFGVIIGTMAAYSLSRFRMKGKNLIVLDILSIRMIPPIVTAVPIFVIARQHGLYDTYGLVIALYVLFNLPIIVWVMKAFIDDIPRDMEDAAVVDGCSTVQALFYVVLPMAAPGLACVTILTLIFNWNEFLLSNILLAGDHRTLPVIAALGLKPRAILWGPASAAAISIIVPVVILTFLVQRWIVRGLSFGAIK